MSWFKSVKSYLFGEVGKPKDQASDSSEDTRPHRASKRTANGASVRKRERTEPVLQDVARPASGGIQGLRWYAASQKLDEDGCMADEFFEESGTSMQPKQASSSRKLGVSKVEAGNVVLSP
mmetsp:Transcript_13986/g.30245  ORF Transcript_13986/g.30245 Transcript_13986/m.30245 type:complete len:121 (-) Transcript_13986:961-1323(-)